MIKKIITGLNCFILGTMVYLYGVEVGKNYQKPVDFQQQINYAVYEALLEGLFLFLLLIYFKNKFSNKPGVISGLFLIIYSIFRFIVEFYRVPDEQLGYIFLNLTMGQVVSLIFILSGVILFYLKYETR